MIRQPQNWKKAKSGDRYRWYRLVPLKKPISMLAPGRYIGSNVDGDVLIAVQLDKPTPPKKIGAAIKAGGANLIRHTARWLRLDPPKAEEEASDG